MEETTLRFRKIGLRISLFAMIIMVAAACTLGASESTTPEAQVISGAPVVTISSPAPNATYLVGTDVNISVRIENAGTDVSRVEIKRDGAIMGTAENPNQSGAASFIIEQGWTAELGEHTFEIVAYRSDGSSSAPGTVTINVVEPRTNATATETTSEDNTTTDVQPTADTSADTSDTDSSQGWQANTDNSDTTDEQQTAATAEPTEKPTSTKVPATATPSVPMGKLNTGANVRSGPDTAFSTIGSLAANSELELYAMDTTRTWYRVEYYNAAEAWIYGTLIDPITNVDSLPLEEGPELPPTATPTPIPTSTPIPSQVNLVVYYIQTSPHPLVCAETSEIQITVQNTGTEASSSGGTINVAAVLNSSGETLESTQTVFGTIAAGATTTVSAYLTVTTHHSELQHIVVTIDSNNQITESNESDNQKNDSDYTLTKGSCP